MAKKVKFPLDMGNEVYVRTLEELKENYNSEKVTEYFLDGRLLTWLNDRYFDDEAEQIQGLMEQEDKNNLAARLGKIFGVEIQDDVDVENLEIRREKLEKLRQITADDEILDNADSVAFSQEELGDLLDNSAEVVYLCGEKFRIPLSVKNVRYIGVNKPVISISGKGAIDLESNGIVIEKCEFSDDTKERLEFKDKNTVKYEDVVINKDPLHLKNGEAESYIINCFVDYCLNNPKPITAKTINEYLIDSAFCDKIVLSADYLNFTYANEFRNFATAVKAQSKYAAKAIKRHGYILCATDDNKEAFASGCLFTCHFSPPLILDSMRLVKEKSCRFGGLKISIKPEKYTEFLEKFAVTSLIALPYKENANISDLEQKIKENHRHLDYLMHSEDIIPLIYIDMGKVIDDMCKKLGKTVQTLDQAGSVLDLGDYCIKISFSNFCNISDYKYYRVRGSE